jgi:hypothetical protein
MSKQIIVSEVSSVDVASALLIRGKVDGGVTVAFSDGNRAVIPSSHALASVWQEVIESARLEDLPIYAETTEDGLSIEQVLIPLIVRVIRTADVEEGDLEVDLEISHARHYLRRTNPRFEELAAVLREALASGRSILVTETDDHSIIDVREAHGKGPPPLATANSRSVGALAFAPAVTVTPGVAQQMFNLVAAKTCDPGTVPVPCIPFLYPDDGCWGRAHEMARLIIAAGQQPGKVWIYGRLRAATRNNPSCAVYWGWHVATTLEVDNGVGGAQTYVIDPSLFTSPIPTAQWSAVQGDPNATLVTTADTVFYRASGGGTSTDPTYSQTAHVLATYRLKLKLRATGSDGPPPYARCP